MQEVSPRSLWSTGIITMIFAVFIAAPAYLVLSLFDGYWLSGTYGYMVFPGLIASCLAVPEFFRVFWAHVVRRSPVIGYREGRFHYLQEGRKSVAAAAIHNVEVRKQGHFSFLHFVGNEGQDLQKYPLMLSTVDGSTVADRVRGYIPTRALPDAV